ncbi:major facilitator superfamily protein [Anoxybacillus flavithermus NBRC 109594]|uniref:Major facilitator superfamily protein n=2 Tax=Anoxybacillus flavithermus TaxID=33934 RepID=R4G1R4_9BACL|nr:major facilitator superfamily protein [Anoxybacillus flavithermus NBRC 109594]
MKMRIQNRKSFLKYAVGLFLATFGSGVYFIASTWMLYDLTGDATYTGLFVGIGFLPGLLLNLFFGTIIDRFNRKLLAILSNLVVTAATGIFLGLMQIGILHAWTIIGLHIIVQLSVSLYRPATQAFLAEIFDKNELPKVYSYTGAIGETGSLIGATLGGIILSFINPKYAILFNGIAFLASGILLFLIPHVNQEKVLNSKLKRSSVIADFIDGFQYLKAHPFLIQLFVIMFVGQLVLHSSNGLLSIYVADFLKKSTSLYGILQSTLSIGNIVGGVLTTWFLLTFKNRISIYSLTTVFIGLFLLTFGSYLPLAFTGVFLIGLGTTWLRVLMQSIQQIVTDKTYHGRMASYRMVINQGSVVVGAPILGVIAEKYGANVSYGVLLIPVFMVLLFAVYFAKQKQFVNVIQSITQKEKKQNAG